MALINSDKKEVEVKLVYYGPGRAGKTSNLEYIYKKFKKRIKGELASIKTHGDRTLFYDSLPLDIGTVKGYNIKVQLYTIPGQIKYATTKKLVLRGADGIVFVADSMVLRQNLNIASFQDLKENLTIFDKDIFKIPLVFRCARKFYQSHYLGRIEPKMHQFLRLGLKNFIQVIGMFDGNIQEICFPGNTVMNTGAG